MTRHLLGLRDLTVPQIRQVLDAAQVCAQRNVPNNPLAGRVVLTLFYEPSTRTEISFELAAKQTGADVVRCDVGRSSVQKGESFADTVHTLEGLGADVLVIRHPAAGAPQLASRWVQCAVINAGDGMHEHPTQGLIDLLTVHQRKGRISALKVAIVGDVLHSRVARSALWGFTKLGARVTLVGPPTLLPRSLSDLSLWEVGGSDDSRQMARVTATSSLEEGLAEVDVVMALRMQLERQHHGYVPSLSEYARTYAITPRTLAFARPDAVLLHPGPMNLGVEVTADAAYGPQSAIQTQVANGVAVRMAVLLWVMGREVATADYHSTEVAAARSRERGEGIPVLQAASSLSSS